MGHIPVLLSEIVKALKVKPGKNYVDATFGGGGHSKAILERNQPGGRVFAFEVDPRRSKKCLGKNKEHCYLFYKSYTDMKKVLNSRGIDMVDGIIFDLGLSSFQLSEGERGFSFQKDGFLDMRFHGKEEDIPQAKAHINMYRKKNFLSIAALAKTFGTAKVTAAHLVNLLDKDVLVAIFKELGEEKKADRVAEEIVKKRSSVPIFTTTELVKLIKKVIPRSKLHPATKVFQALRMAVNRELSQIKIGINGAIELLTKGGRLAVISFHSLEDRLVKTIFNNKEDEKVLYLPEPNLIRPKEEEIRKNVRCRSARLRVAEKI